MQMGTDTDDTTGQVCYYLVANPRESEMNRKINWWLIVTLVFLGALAFTSASSLLGWGLGRGGSDNGWERWRSGMGAHWEIRQIAFLPFRCLMPALFITLVVVGIIWLVQAISASPGQGAGGSRTVPARRGESQEETCTECGRSVQAGWQVCPYCGQKLN